MVESWFFLESPAGDAATNMAVDEALLRTAAGRTRPLLRVYSWLKPAVSIGYFQKFPAPLAGRYEIVRRPTGGGLVYHVADTTYTLVVPPTHRLYTMPTTEAYCEIHKAVAVALSGKSEIADRKSPISRPDNECFQNPVAGDVVADGRKMAGAAQRRNKSGMLHQGSIAAQVSAEQLRRALGVEFRPYALSTEETLGAQWLADGKYRNDAWNKRVI